MGKTIIHRDAPSSYLAFLTAQAMENCGVEVFSVSCDSKIVPYSQYSVWGHSSVTLENRKYQMDRIEKEVNKLLDELEAAQKLAAEEDAKEKSSEDDK